MSGLSLALALALSVSRAAVIEPEGDWPAVEVRGGKADLKDVPVRATVRVPDLPADARGVWVVPAGGEKGGEPVWGQVMERLGTDAVVVWVAPEIKAGARTKWEIAPVTAGCGLAGFVWQNDARGWLDLIFNRRAVSRYMLKRDTSSAARAHETYKPYHHVYDRNGLKFITKGPHGLYTHHRGIFFGWNKVQFKGRGYDLWHMNSGEVQLHRKFEDMTAGPVLARSVSIVDWKTADEGDVILVERRESVWYRQSAPTLALADFTLTVRAAAPVVLGGDPEHAGFQFRASNAISGRDDREGSETVALGNNRGAEYLFHADGVDPKKDRGLPWVAMSYVLDGAPYSVVHMSHPDNSKLAVYSAYRDYGRFGSWAYVELGDRASVTFKYRLWITASAMPSREECAARYAAYAAPPGASRAD